MNISMISKKDSARVDRALLSLDGLSIGDAFGERFFGPRRVVVDRISSRTLPSAPWEFTDDTMMALSIVSVLMHHQCIDQDALASNFAKNYTPTRGYGAGMHTILPRIRQGEPWQPLAQALFGGQGSFGNGASMRVAPVGAFFADDLDAVVDNARLSSKVTHSHPEATAGAIGVSLASAFAYRLRKESPPDVHEFIQPILTHIPKSYTRIGIENAMELGTDVSTTEAAKLLGSGYEVTTQDTVPFVIWCSGRYLGNFQEALWQAVSGLGDRDTTCAMVGGIVAAYVGRSGIPKDWLERRESLPNLPLSG